MKCRNCKNPRWAEEYPGRPFFGWCDEINDSPDMDIERECRCFAPASNADIIRRMSDEELAKTIYGMQKDLCKHFAEAVGYTVPLEFDEDAPDILDWLKKPAKEDA